ENPVLDGRLSRSLSQGIPLSELEWDSLPDRKLARDLILTKIRPGRYFGRIRMAFPEYRLVSRQAGESLGPKDPPLVSEGDTLWVTSRGKTWAFSLDRVPGVSRVAAPVAVRFVRRPRTSGWALPSSEACGGDTHRCAVLSTQPLPPPQAHFDLGGFGLDTARYSLLARLEPDREGVRLVGADFEARLAYGEVYPLPALPASDEFPATGFLVRVSRAAQGQQSAVIVTVLGLFLLILGALATISGAPDIWERRKSTAPNMSAAWAFVNVFLIFLGVRLALGLRVAYSPPFYDRAAATAVGLWITFAVMLVALGRWSSWAPTFWRLVRRLERPMSRMFLPGVNGSGAHRPKVEVKGTGSEPLNADEKRARRRGRYRTTLGLLLMVFSIGLLLWQRPEAAASLLVAATGIGAWLGMGLSRRQALVSTLDRHPLNVITAEGGPENPALSLALAAGGSGVLALAIHAPWMALIPVLFLLFLFVANHLLRRWKTFEPPVGRGWGLFGLILLVAEVGVLALFPWPEVGTAALLGAGLVGGVFLRRAPGGDSRTLMEMGYQGFLSMGGAVFSGIGWVGVLTVLGLLVFLSAQAI
ncbi:MAG: hypothetical protein MUO50_04140, partial [Longimicrobiales bacterium]|nr:hypothetical protein [Longimicrobiales bacterium]